MTETNHCSSLESNARFVMSKLGKGLYACKRGLEWLINKVKTLAYDILSAIQDPFINGYTLSDKHAITKLGKSVRQGKTALAAEQSFKIGKPPTKTIEEDVRLPENEPKEAVALHEDLTGMAAVSNGVLSEQAATGKFRKVVMLSFIDMVSKNGAIIVDALNMFDNFKILDKEGKVDKKWQGNLNKFYAYLFSDEGQTPLVSKEVAKDIVAKAYLKLFKKQTYKPEQVFNLFIHPKLSLGYLRHGEDPDKVNEFIYEITKGFVTEASKEPEVSEKEAITLLEGALKVLYPNSEFDEKTGWIKGEETLLAEVDKKGNIEEITYRKNLKRLIALHELGPETKMALVIAARETLPGVEFTPLINRLKQMPRSLDCFLRAMDTNLHMLLSGKPGEANKNTLMISQLVEKLSTLSLGLLFKNVVSSYMEMNLGKFLDQAISHTNKQRKNGVTHPVMQKFVASLTRQKGRPLTKPELEQALSEDLKKGDSFLKEHLKELSNNLIDTFFTSELIDEISKYLYRHRGELREISKDYSYIVKAIDEILGKGDLINPQAEIGVVNKLRPWLIGAIGLMKENVPDALKDSLFTDLLAPTKIKERIIENAVPTVTEMVVSTIYQTYLLEDLPSIKDVLYNLSSKGDSLLRAEMKISTLLFEKYKKGVGKDTLFSDKYLEEVAKIYVSQLRQKVLGLVEEGESKSTLPSALKALMEKTENATPNEELGELLYKLMNDGDVHNLAMFFVSEKKGVKKIAEFVTPLLNKFRGEEANKVVAEMISSGLSVYKEDGKIDKKKVERFLTAKSSNRSKAEVESYAEEETKVLAKAIHELITQGMGTAIFNRFVQGNNSDHLKTVVIKVIDLLLGNHALNVNLGLHILDDVANQLVPPVHESDESDPTDT